MLVGGAWGTGVAVGGGATVAVGSGAAGVFVGCGGDGVSGGRVRVGSDFESAATGVGGIGVGSDGGLRLPLHPANIRPSTMSKVGKRFAYRVWERILRHISRSSLADGDRVGALRPDSAESGSRVRLGLCKPHDAPWAGCTVPFGGDCYHASKSLGPEFGSGRTARAVVRILEPCAGLAYTMDMNAKHYWYGNSTLRRLPSGTAAAAAELSAGG